MLGGFRVPAFAIVGMAAMVGGGTGAAMTAGHDDLRDDARLRHRDANDHRGCRQHWRPTRSFAREHLHDQASEPPPLYSEGIARKHVSNCTTCNSRPVERFSDFRCVNNSAANVGGTAAVPLQESRPTEIFSQFPVRSLSAQGEAFFVPSSPVLEFLS